MPGRYLRDTNAVIDLFAQNEELAAKLEAAEAVFISTVVLGEMYFGAEKSHRVAENHARIEALAAESTVLAPDLVVAREYGRVKESLKSRGRPIPENDVWIAATALAHGLTMLSRVEQPESLGFLGSSRQIVACERVPLLGSFRHEAFWNSLCSRDRALR